MAIPSQTAFQKLILTDLASIQSLLLVGELIIVLASFLLEPSSRLPFLPLTVWSSAVTALFRPSKALNMVADQLSLTIVIRVISFIRMMVVKPSQPQERRIRSIRESIFFTIGLKYLTWYLQWLIPAWLSIVFSQGLVIGTVENTLFNHVVWTFTEVLTSPVGVHSWLLFLCLLIVLLFL